MLPKGVDPSAKYPHPISQYFHGGQSYRQCPNFKCDFSVTTNISGPPKSAIEAAKATFADMEHYPEQDAWVPRCWFADFIGLTPSECLLGNGSSELIDVTCRIFPKGTTWRQGPWSCQYREYARSSAAAGLVEVDKNSKHADLTIIVNPNSPTGDFLELDYFRKVLNDDPTTTLIVDESFIICYGRDWKEKSCMKLIPEFGDRIIVHSSWTKVYACPGLRLGTVVSTSAIIDRIAALQCPWSVNGFAQAFFVKALQEKDYFNEMWEYTPIWKKEMHELLKSIHVKPNENSPLWVPYEYCDFLSPEIASFAEKIAFDAGFPVRNCTDFGEGRFLRFGVRKIEYFRELIEVLRNNKKLMAMIISFQ